MSFDSSNRAFLRSLSAPPAGRQGERPATARPDPRAVVPRADKPLTVEERMTDGVLVVALIGSLRSASGRALAQTLDRALSAGDHRIVVDASSLTDADRHGMHVLANAAERAGDWSTPFVIAGLPAEFLPFLEPGGPADMLSPTVAAAITAVRNRYVPGEPTRSDLLEGLHDVERRLDQGQQIERAVGALSVICGITPDQAFDLLHQTADLHEQDATVLATRIFEDLCRNSIISHSAGDPEQFFTVVAQTIIRRWRGHDPSA